MNKYLHFLFLSAIGLCACKSDNDANQTSEKVAPKTTKASKTTSTAKYRGHWIDKDFVENMEKNHSVTAIGVLPSIIELTFPAVLGDSATLVSGIKTNKTLFNNPSADVFTFDGGKLVYENIGEQEKLIFTDIANKPHTLIRVGDNEVGGDGKAIQPIVNKHTLVGDYFILDKKGKKGDDFIIFKPDGGIIGMEEFNKYEVCVGGDCRKLVTDKKDVFYLSRDGKGDYYAFEVKDYDKDPPKMITPKPYTKEVDGEIVTITPKAKPVENARRGIVLVIYKIDGTKDFKSSVKLGEIKYELGMKK